MFQPPLAKADRPMQILAGSIPVASDPGSVGCYQKMRVTTSLSSCTKKIAIIGEMSIVPPMGGMTLWIGSKTGSVKA